MSDREKRNPARLRERKAVVHAEPFQQPRPLLARVWRDPRGEVEAGYQALYLPLVKVPEQRFEFELSHSGEVDGIRVRGTLSRGAGLLKSARKREQGTEDERVLGQEVPVNAEKTVLDLRTRKAGAKSRTCRVVVSNSLASIIRWAQTDLEDRHFVGEVKFFVSARSSRGGRRSTLGNFSILRLEGN